MAPEPGRHRECLPLRRPALSCLLAAAIACGVLIGCSGSSAGPLQPVRTVNSFGFPVERGQLFSFVFWHRSEVAVTATLRGVSLLDPDPGLELVDSGITLEELQDPFYSSFPPAALTSLAGAMVTIVPGDPSSDVTFVLGLRATGNLEALAARGVWLDYEVGGQRYRAALPWLLRVCIEPVARPCQSQEPSQFSFSPD